MDLMLQKIKARDCVQAFSSAQQVSQPTPRTQTGSRVLTGMMQGYYWAHHSVRRMVRVQFQLTRTRLSFPEQMRLCQHYSSQPRLLSRKQTWLFPHRESWNELSRVASLTCFPVRRFLSSRDGGQVQF